jgi:hypothetical protein
VNLYAWLNACPCLNNDYYVFVVTTLRMID